jgi:hypothetical protein
LAREAGAYPGKYLIYLQCPHENRKEDSGTGCTVADEWIGPTPSTKEGVKQLFYREVAARIAVLHAVVEAGGSPMDWLAYMLSDNGGEHIRRVRNKLPPDLRPRILNELLESPLLRNRVVMVLDDAHLLLALQKVEDTSVLKLMRRAAWAFEAPFVICGTQVSIEAFSDGPQHVRIADPSSNYLHQSILGTYHYLEPNEVVTLLQSILSVQEDDADTSTRCVSVPDMLGHLGNTLQGRGGTLAGFVTLLLSSPLAIATKLTPNKLGEVLAMYMNDVALKFTGELETAGLEGPAAGHLLCRAMLSKSSTLRQTTTAQFGLLPFARKVSMDIILAPGVSEVAAGYRTSQQESDFSTGHASCRLKAACVVGEPGLLEALVQRFEAGKITRHDVSEGLEIYLGYLERFGGPTSSSAHATAIAMMVLADGTELPSKLAIIHRSQCLPGVPSPLERCAGFHLHVRRIVRVSTEEQMREYLACVARGLDDASFSLCTGVPVQRVAVLRSGACGSGLIAVATSGSDVRAISVAGVDGTSETQGERCSAAHAISTSASASAHTDTPHACKKRKITSGAEWMLLNFVDNSHKQCTQGIARCETRQQVAATAAKKIYAAVTGVGREVTDPVPAVLTVLFEIPSGTVPEYSQDYVVLGGKEVLDHQLVPEGTVRVLTQRK